MNWKTWIPLVLAVAFGLLAAKTARDVLLRGPRSAGAAETGRPRVVVARTDLAPGIALSDKDVRLAEISGDTVPAGSLRSVAEAIGRVLLRPVVKDQPVDESTLAPPGTAAGPQALVPPGMRAVTLEINEVSGVGGLVVPGSAVDVVCTINDGGRGKPVSRTIVENVRVLAIGQRLAGAPHDGEHAPAKSATLLVNPRQAEELELAASAGRTRLTLRGPLDGAVCGGSGVTLADLLGPAERLSAVAPPVETAPAPATRSAEQPQHTVAVLPPQTQPAQGPPVAKRHVVELISGGEATRLEFDPPSQQPATAATDQRDAPGAMP